MKKSDTAREGKPIPHYGFNMLFKEDEKYYFHFNDAEGEPLLFSKSYSTEKGCANGIQAVIRAAGNDEQYEIKETKKGKCFFILKSGNHKEVGRSRLFETQEELEEQMALLKGIDEDVPQYGLEETPPEIPKKEEKAPEAPRKVEQKAEAQDKPPVPAEGSEKMPRYKFSVIYYPDSKVWMVKNDFSGESVKLKTCNGQKIEAFLRGQVPAGDLEPAQPVVRPEGVARSNPAARREAAMKPPEPMPDDVEMHLRTRSGELIKKIAEKNSIGKVELIPKVRGSVQPHAFKAEIMAKSLDNNQPILIGAAKGQDLVEGRFEVPIYGAAGLKPGLYRVIANIYQSSEGEPASEYHGSQLIMLN
ncbi:MAG: YegP family protein [Phaeodactylibacter sp.]|nr:YegP family protein [Phaeodactylibacter sp.]